MKLEKPRSRFCSAPRLQSCTNATMFVAVLRCARARRPYVLRTPTAAAR